MSGRRRRPRVVVVGLGDTGVLTAMRLARRFEVVGVATKPGLVSGQELGLRLARPAEWAADYWIGFDRLRRMDPVTVLSGRAVALDRGARTVTVEDAAGVRHSESYDALVIATGVANGFWRDASIEGESGVAEGLGRAHADLDAASTLAVIGGGAAGVSSAYNAAVRWPEARVDLYFPGQTALAQHHRGVWRDVEARLRGVGVGLHGGHRASVPDDAAAGITRGPITWTTGQPASAADAVLWTVGRVRPHTDWLPADLLDAGGFVAVRPTLQAVAGDRIFAIGDVAATDPLRSSARNRADKLLARNVRAVLEGGSLASYRAPGRRWGSVLGFQRHGLIVYAANGRPFRIPRWWVVRVLKPVIVRRGIYGGVRRRAS